ncbi:MAG: DUF3574 domain-containing protein [Ruminococcaceae bacterium]|nr:DUF3574 domain-containing protein [Oscillospiraceae bacterium]
MKKNENLAIVISILSLICSAVCVVLLLSNGNAPKKTPADTGKSTQYVMYVGTNDKDTYQPEHSQEEARDIVDAVCLKYFEGYTLQDATGAWTDEAGNITHEYTLVCYFDDADKDTVYRAADEVIKALNQNTVLIEENEISIEYYGGK